MQVDEDKNKEDDIDEDDVEDQDQDSEEEDLDDEPEVDDEDSEDEDEDSEEEDDEENNDDEEEEDEDEFDEKDLDDPEKRKGVLKLLKRSKSAMKQRAKWKARALKAEQGDKKPEAKVPKKVTTGTKNQAAAEETRQAFERNEFRLDHTDLPRRMVDEIQKYAVANGMTMEKALRRPLIQRYVSDKKLKERLSKASPSSRHRSPQSAPKKDWSTASAADVAAHEAEVRRRNRK